MSSSDAAARTLELVAIVGDAHVRDAGPGDAVNGMPAALVVEPASTEEAARVLRSCSSGGLAVVVRGAGSKLAWGAPPERLDVVLSTARMHAVLEHASGDLVARAQPGVALAEFQATVAASGQMLALDPPEPAATVGGVVGAAASGPRRLRYGTPRDLLIGITAVLSDGTVAKAGGRVVKNVAGYDLCKLFAGSFGTLGLIAELTFRLHPRPDAARVLEVEVGDPDAALAAVRMAISAALVPSAVELTWPAATGPGVVRALYEGFEPGVEAQADRARSLFGHPTSQGIGPPAVTDRWDADGPAFGDRPEAPATLLRVKLAHPPASLPDAIRAAWSSCGPATQIRGHAATGVTYVDVDAGSAEPASMAGALHGLRAFAASVAGSAVVQHAAPAVGGEADVWGPAGDTLQLMRRVKERFDPTRTLSPGRFVGGI